MRWEVFRKCPPKKLEETLNMVSSVCTWTPVAAALSETDYQRYFKSIQILLIAVGSPICILNVAPSMCQPEPSVCTPSLVKKQISIDALWLLYKIMPKLIQKKKKATIVNMDLKNNRGQYIVINIRNRAEINTNNDRYKGKKNVAFTIKMLHKEMFKKRGEGG